MRPIYLTRIQAAKFVREQLGLSCSPNWLAKLIVTGGGPRYWKFGRAVRYRADALEAWTFQRLEGPFENSSERARSKSTFSYLKSGLGMPFEEA
ncbi:AlpA family transcriptional regulator [Notoacmeibacter sp. MSK16QG-6]|uniref:helix-turn-helix transcriptional regulator n=1 Tax=Notoacmeibacter sp. MSK16QG-6 TaxID=2957982 RepID=UPI0020A01B54|nr:hypothetical protein [Notoacmeibacter sp. MSK16QG-6]MCP1199073.1 hypothetical protein [Notoacmeibacter sp. MSK16QG-6]